MSDVLHSPTLRVIKIIDAVSNSENGLTLSDLSRELQISKSTLQPILKTLASCDFLIIDESKTYKIGPRLFKYGQKYINNFDVLDIIKAHMREIVHTCNEVCQLGVEDSANHGNVLYLHKEEPYQAVKLMSYVGMSLPANVSALGKSILTKYSDDEIRNLYKNGLEKLTKNSISDIELLIKEVNDVKKFGYAHENGEASSDIECYAVPIYYNGELYAAISVSVPTYRMNDMKREQIINLLLSHKNIFNSFPK